MSAHPSVISFNQAIVREPAPTVVKGLRAHDRGSPDFAGVLIEHRAYVAALEQAGLSVQTLDPLPDYPDSLFVEDPALVFGQGAILLRPGAASREAETALLAPALRSRFERVLQISAGFADGGDVLVTRNKVLIGLSARTDRAGATSLIECLAQLGRAAEMVATPKGVLHFKSDCSLIDEQTILVTERLAASGIFAGWRQILVPPGEEAAANALRVNDHLLLSAGYEGTRERLQNCGATIIPLPTTEIAKIDAGLSCMSLRWLNGALT